MKKKIFVLSYTGYYNLGDDLMIDLIDEEKFPGFEIFVLSRRTYYKKKLKYINRYNLIKYFLSINKGNILINLGGIFQDKTGFLSFFYYFIMNLIFLLKKGQIIFLNTDFLDVQYNNKFIYFLLKYSQLTVIRSKTEYRNYFKRFKNVYYCPDIVFLYKFDKLKKNRKGAPYIMISLRGHEKINQFLEKLIQSGHKFKFLLMHNERSLKKVVKKYFPENDIYIYNYFNKNKIFNLIYNAEKIITMRYHIGILGLLFNKRTLIIDISNKMRILNEDFGLSYINSYLVSYCGKKYLSRCRQGRFTSKNDFILNEKKNIDKINKSIYINKRKIKKSWEGLINKVHEIYIHLNPDKRRSRLS